jgi:hypothetical protein
MITWKNLGTEERWVRKPQGLVLRRSIESINQ